MEYYIDVNGKTMTEKTVNINVIFIDDEELKTILMKTTKKGFMTFAECHKTL